MHFVFELKTTKNLACVLLEVAELMHDLRVISTFATDFVELIIQAKVLETRQELCLLAF